LIELVHDELTPGRCLAYVRQANSGALALFVGCVRNVSEGKHVDFLEYEAFEPMALQKLEQVRDETRERWPLNAMAIQHRLGRLEIGDDAVVIAVSSLHRAEAFDACEYAIDRIKEIVPIWKKEHGERGQTWVGGPPYSSESSNHDRDTG